MSEKTEKVLDAEHWRVEARAVMRDVRVHVLDIDLCHSPSLTSTNRGIYFNLTTLEGRAFCVRLSAQGFQIVGERHDCADIEKEESPFFETIYALLDSVSPDYKVSFANTLIDKLQEFQDSEK